MTNELRVFQGINFFLLIIQWTATYANDNGVQIVNQENGVPGAKLGEICGVEVCQKHLFCDENLICQCRPGFKDCNNDCLPISGEENKYCTTSKDCCGDLLCINGLCRTPAPTSEFVTLAKICLGITVTTIVIAAFSSLLKCLIRYENSTLQRRRTSSSLNSSGRLRGHVFVPASLNPVPELKDEKPPSYEDCMRLGIGRPVVTPPPYTISSDPVVIETDQLSQFPVLPAVNSQNLTTPLNVSSLNNDVNLNIVIPQNSEGALQNSVKGLSK